MDLTPETGVHFSSNPRHKDMALLLDIAIIMSSNLENAEHQIGKHISNAIEHKQVLRLVSCYLLPP